MGLEAIMIALDNSEYTRNGDYAPSRFEAQSETIQFVANAKLNDNQESTVGILSLAGKRIEVHVSPCRSVGAIMSSIAKDVHIGGQSNFIGGLKTAALALKNRQNKNQRQRIIMFVASPIADSADELVKLGKALKKNSVAVDVINFGAENATNENAEKLEAFINAINTGDNSHLVNIPPGPHILSDLVLSSAIMSDSASARVAVGGGGGGGMGDIDPNLDPELAMAIRMSMEEERARQAAAAGGSTSAGTAAAPATPAPTGAAMTDLDDEDALLAQAIALSMQQESAAMDTADSSTSTTTTPAPAPAPSTLQTGGSEAIAHAVAPVRSTNSSEEIGLDLGDAMQDQDFINSLLQSVPGVKKDEVQLDNLLEQLTGAGAEKKPKDDKKSDEQNKDEKKEDKK